MTAGTVYFVGAGPGDPELITMKGVRVMQRADVVVYDGLANVQLLAHAPAAAERIYAGEKHSPEGAPPGQVAVNQLLADKAAAGLDVVRLEGGDPFVFGRGAEEAAYLRARGIAFEIVPGVTAATAVPAYAGIPLTHRDPASSVIALTTGSAAQGGDAFTDASWDVLAGTDTLVLFMAVTTVGDCASRLMAAGKAPDTPAAAIRWGTTPSQTTLEATLGTLEARIAAEALRPPALIVIGEVVNLRGALSWYESRPLFGARVLIPRELDRAAVHASAIQALGGEPFVMPVTRIEATDPGPLADALRQPPRWLVVTSRAAVAPIRAALASAGKDARHLHGTRIAAIGPATASALDERGLTPDLVPEREATGRELAEAMLAHDPDLAGRGSRVLLPRQEHGRDELPTALRHAGATVDVVTAYRTSPRSPAELGPIAERLEAGELGIVTFFAPSQVDAVCAALPPDGASLFERPLVAAWGSTTEAALVAHGITADIVTGEPDPHLWARALATLFQARKPA